MSFRGLSNPAFLLIVAMLFTFARPCPAEEAPPAPAAGAEAGEALPPEPSKAEEALHALQQRILARPTVHNRTPYEVVVKQGESTTFVLSGKNLHKITSATITYRNDDIVKRGVNVTIGKVTPKSLELTVSVEKTASTGTSYTVRLYMNDNTEMYMSPYYSTFTVRSWDDRPQVRPLPPRTRDRVIEDVEDGAPFPHVGR